VVVNILGHADDVLGLLPDNSNTHTHTHTHPSAPGKTTSESSLESNEEPEPAIAKGAEGWGALDDLDDDDAAVSPNSHPRVPSTSAPRAALPPNAPSSTGKNSQKSDF
jgi:hypothetical protein